LKIIIFINSLAGGGAERVAATLANYWAREQWDVTIVTLAPLNEDFYALDPAIKRVAMGLAGESANVLDGLRQNARRVLALRKIVMQLRPEVVLSMMSTPNVLLALACWGLPDVCAIGSERCYPPHFPLGRMWHALRRKLYGRLHAVAALTRECASWIKANSSARRIPVIPNPVSWPMPSGLPIIEPEKICLPGRKVLLAVGRLSQEKGFEVLIKVFSRLADRHPDWDLVILGEGPERETLQMRIRESAFKTRIAIPGIAGNVGEWYARADLYVMSSFYEGFPNALAEALAHGLPAVSFDCDTGPRDIIRHGIDGLLVPLGSAGELQVALDRLMGDDELRKTLAARAVDARERFSIKKIAYMWESLFKELRSADAVPKARHADTANERVSP
jgi:glycosyltransferase involved in cell wall biosynthesis